MRVVYYFFHILKYKITRVVDILHTKCRLWGNGVKYKNYRIVGVPYIQVIKGGIEFGDRIVLNNGIRENLIGFNTPCILRAENGSIRLGNNVGMSQTALIAKGADIIIGNNVKLGGGVKVYTSDFHCLDYIKRRDPKTDMKERSCASVNIEDDCFIGAGTIVLKGVRIGARSIIGAGSLVTKDIPCDVIAGGNPCMVIKKID